MRKGKKIPRFKSYEEMGEFWDSHSLSDYWDETEPAEFTVSEGARKRYLVSFDRELITRLHKVAHNRGISTESLANLLV